MLFGAKEGRLGAVVCGQRRPVPCLGGGDPLDLGNPPPGSALQRLSHRVPCKTTAAVRGWGPSCCGTAPLPSRGLGSGEGGPEGAVKGRLQKRPLGRKALGGLLWRLQTGGQKCEGPVGQPLYFVRVVVGEERVHDCIRTGGKCAVGGGGGSAGWKGGWGPRSGGCKPVGANRRERTVPPKGWSAPEASAPPGRTSGRPPLFHKAVPSSAAGPATMGGRDCQQKKLADSGTPGQRNTFRKGKPWTGAYDCGSLCVASGTLWGYPWPKEGDPSLRAQSNGASLHSARAHRPIASERPRDPPEHPPIPGGATSTRQKGWIQTAIWHFQCETEFVFTRCLRSWTE